MQETILEETLRLVRNSSQSVEQIAAGASVGTRWLYRLIAGDYGDPGVNKIERLSRYLKERAS